MQLRDIFEAKAPTKVLCIFPGGFHPFHSGHASVYQYLRKKFPTADVYVASSNKTTERPFAFKDKQFLASQAGIPADRFVEVVSPYKAMEITQHYNPESTVLIFALSEKDKDRLGKPLKKDGTPSYMQPFPGSIEKCQPFIKHGYYVVTPTIKFSVLGQPISSASQIREMYAKADDRTRMEIAEDLYPISQQIPKVKKILDKVLGSVVAEAIFQRRLLREAERDMILQELAPLFNIPMMPPVDLESNGKMKNDMLAHTLWCDKKPQNIDVPYLPYLFGVVISPLAARDKAIYKQVLAHELCHVEDLINNVFPILKKNPDAKLEDDHGSSWKAIANRINGKLGANYVNEFSDTKVSIFGNLKRGPSLKNVTEHIVKLKSGKYRLLSHKGKNLGTFDSHAAAAKHEGEVEYFKHMKESPDFGYGSFYNRDAELNELQWDVRKLIPSGEAIGIFASEMRKGEEQQSFEFAPEKYVVARIGLQIEEENGKPFRATVRQSGIGPAWKGTGLGQILYDKAIAYAKKRGCKFFCSDVQRTMEAESAWQKLKKRYPVEKHSNYYIIDLRKV